MRRQTSFISPVDLAIDREIDSKYDVIASVAEQIGAIEDINEAIANGTLDNMLNIINMLVATGDEGTNATWNGTTLTVPRGDTGDRGAVGTAGLHGMSPVIEFDYDETSGQLTYEQVGFVDINTGNTLAISTIEGLPGLTDQVEDQINTPEEW